MTTDDKQTDARDAERDDGNDMTAEGERIAARNEQRRSEREARRQAVRDKLEREQEDQRAAR